MASEVNEFVGLPLPVAHGNPNRDSFASDGEGPWKRKLGVECHSMDTNLHYPAVRGVLGR